MGFFVIAGGKNPCHSITKSATLPLINLSEKVSKEFPSTEARITYVSIKKDVKPGQNPNRPCKYPSIKHLT